ncbi:MAG: hypothetical protein AAF515_10845 [Pseudomonadota bacterium]
MKISYSQQKLLRARRNMMLRTLVLLVLVLAAITAVLFQADPSTGVWAWVLIVLLAAALVIQIGLYFRAPLIHSFEISDIGVLERRESHARQDERLYRWADIWEVSRTAEGSASSVLRLRTSAGRDPWIQGRLLDEAAELVPFARQIQERPRGQPRPRR